MSQALIWIKRAVKRALRPLADALLASSQTFEQRVENCLANSPTLTDRVEEHLRNSEALTNQIEVCLAHSQTLPARVDECVLSSESLYSRVEQCLSESNALSARIEQHLSSSIVLPARIERCLKHSAALPGRIEDCIGKASTLPLKVEELLLTSKALPRRVEEHLPTSKALPTRIEECLAQSEKVWLTLEELLAQSQVLPGRVDALVASSEPLRERVEECLTRSDSLARRIEEYLSESEALVGRVEECAASSPLVPIRVEECLAGSEVLPERVDECIRTMRTLADRIEECLWSSRALPRRIDEHLAGSKVLTDILIEEALRRSAVLPHILTDLLPDNPCLAAVLHPYQEDYPVAIPVVSANSDGVRDATGLPVPPRELWEGQGASAEEHLAAADAQVRVLREVLAAAGAPLESASRLLDFTCGAGRALRGLAELAATREIWGVDVSAPHVVWVRQHLCPPFRVATRSTYPHLPFEDRYFDLVWSLVPFGRPADLADAWLLELRRVLRPGGKAYLCVLDKPAVERLMATGAGGNEAVLRAALSTEKNQELLHSAYASLAVRTPLGVQVLYDPDYLKEHWGRELRIVSITPNACGPYTAYLLERP